MWWFKTSHIHHLTVSVGQEFLHSLTGSFARIQIKVLFWTSVYPPSDWGRICFLAHSFFFCQNSVPWCLWEPVSLHFVASCWLKAAITSLPCGLLQDGHLLHWSQQGRQSISEIDIAILHKVTMTAILHHFFFLFSVSEEQITDPTHTQGAGITWEHHWRGTAITGTF